MALVVAYDEIKPDQIKRNKGGPDSPASTNLPYFRASADTPGAPSAFLARYDPDAKSCAHFHAVDQFQILVQGKGTLGHHEVAPSYIHSAPPYTPYRPLHPAKDIAVTFIT